MTLNPVRINGLPAATQVNDNDFIVVEQAGVTKKAAKSIVTAGSGSSIATLLKISVSGPQPLALQSGDYIQAIIFIGADGPVKVGSSSGQGDIIDDSISGGSGLLEYSLVPSPYQLSPKTLHFTGNYTAKILLWRTG